jgi:hypothetical protein
MAFSWIDCAGAEPQHGRMRSPDLKIAMAENRAGLADFENISWP